MSSSRSIGSSIDVTLTIVAALVIAFFAIRTSWIDAYSPACDLPLREPFKVGSTFRWRNLARFPWNDLAVFDSHVPADNVRALGVDYHPSDDSIPKGSFMIVFLTNGRAECAELMATPIDVHFEQIKGEADSWVVRSGNYWYLPEPREGTSPIPDPRWGLLPPDA